ncbi:hypothetical protein BDB01DRAFT_803598 [Pilobolus umbonatus]|nr:hypothetical protein BDB01DRAFT_803598 [Pilobolus umbonatus]
MNSLPTEVIHLIARQLVFIDLRWCIRVNQQWYGWFIEHYYSEITPPNEHKLKQFLGSLVMYPNCRKAGIYVKQLNLTRLESGEEFKINDERSITFIDALVLCPNLERLVLEPRAHILQICKNPKMPQLKKLKYIQFYRLCTETFHKAIIECYRKYRDTLVSINLGTMTNVISEFTTDNLVSYIASFACLRKLVLQLPLNYFHGIPMVHLILTNCPQLQNALFKCNSLYTFNYTSMQAHKNLRELHLEVEHLKLCDARYIKDHCLQLGTLNIDNLNTIVKPSEIIRVLMQIRSLKQVRLCLATHSKEVCQTFWESIRLLPQYRPQRDCHKAKFFSEYTLSGSSTYTFSTTTSNQNIITSKVCSPSVFKDPYDEYLGQSARFINRLDISNNDYLDILRVNSWFPLLDTLVLCNIASLSILHSPSRHRNLRTLVLDRCDISNALFKQIEQNYPMLQNLTLLYPSYSMSDNIRLMVGYIQLPRTGLKRLSIFELSDRSPFSPIVLRDSGDHTHLWHAHTGNTGIPAIEDSKLETSRDLLGNRILIRFKSATVEDVVISLMKCV